MPREHGQGRRLHPRRVWESYCRGSEIKVVNKSGKKVANNISLVKVEALRQARNMQRFTTSHLDRD